MSFYVQSCSIQLCLFVVVTFKFCCWTVCFVETLFLNSFKHSDEGNTFATLTFVMSDRFYARLFV